MSLAEGQRLGPYEVLGRIGAGGMGEVYRARDTRLDRRVALKVLASELSGDGALRSRFEREARAISALAHPHICTLFDVGEQDGRTFLVMEHLEGQTLLERLRTGPLPLAQAVEIATQVAQALSAAHKQGIVHRDLKPGNVMLTKTGAKLLDFGLARLTAHGERAAVESLTAAPTASAPLTGHGRILGTLPYMAPEQLEGRPADARTDLWALGLLIYEILTGRRAFEGSSQVSLIGAILEREPEPLGRLQPLTPPSLERLVKRCLAKSPDDRWDTAHDVADELRWIADTGPAAAESTSRPPLWKRTIGLAVPAIACILLGALADRWLRPRVTPASPVVRTLLDVQPAEELNGGGVAPLWVPTPGGSRTALDWTPDERALVYVGRRGGTQQLYVRDLARDEAHVLAGTEGAQAPSVSTDGRWVAFWAGGAIKRMARWPDIGPGSRVGLPTARDGVGSERSPLLRRNRGSDLESGSRDIAGAGHDTPGNRAHSRAAPCPSRRESAALHRPAAGDDVGRRRGCGAGPGLRRAKSPASRCRRLAQRRQRAPRLHAPGRAHGRGLRSRRADGAGRTCARSRRCRARAQAGNSDDITGAGQFAVATSGTLAYLPGPVRPYPNAALVAVDRVGRPSPLAAPTQAYAPTLDLTPDGRRLAVVTLDIRQEVLRIVDTSRGTVARLAGGGEAGWPRWTPDGQRVAFSRLVDGVQELVWQRADATTAAEPLVRGGHVPSSWSPDGQHLATVLDRGIWIVTVARSTSTLDRLSETSDREWWPEFSPDGRWLAYGSNATGRNEIYVQPWPGRGPREQVSLEGGEQPAWNPNGRELFFTSPPDAAGRWRMWAVDVQTRPLRIGTPRPLFDSASRELVMRCLPTNCYFVSPDGSRFFATQILPDAPIPPVTHIRLIQGWVEEMKARVSGEPAR